MEALARQPLLNLSLDGTALVVSFDAASTGIRLYDRRMGAFSRSRAPSPVG